MTVSQSATFTSPCSNRPIPWSAHSPLGFTGRKAQSPKISHAMLMALSKTAARRAASARGKSRYSRISSFSHA